MPRPSAAFDCDDSALLMVERFNKAGIKAAAILGNLKMAGETYGETDHIWVFVYFAGFRIAFDWGMPQLDKQHYEGYVVTNDKLNFFVNQDSTAKSQIPAVTFP